MGWGRHGIVLSLGFLLTLGADERPAQADPTSRVAIRFVEPERYTDADDRYGSGPGLRGTLAEIRRILEISALRVMAPGTA